MTIRRTTLGCTLAAMIALPVSAAAQASVHDVIHARNAQIEAWYAAEQIDSLATAFAEDVWQMPPNMPALVGREAVHGFWSQAMGWGDWTFDLEAQDIVALDGNVVTFAAGPQAPAGMASFEDRGNYVVLWRRDADGTWRIVWDAPVSEVPLGGG